MGSRYGGLKQIDPIHDNGEFIIDYSVYDAILAGFNKVVFVIKKEIQDEFRETIGKRFEHKIKVEYVFQELDDLPRGFKVPEGRTKPWGTAHALLAARNKVKEPFAVINADDFYGRDAYRLLSAHLSGQSGSAGVFCGVPEYCMVGYILNNTLTENGAVSRGVCRVSDDGILVDVTERTKIFKKQDGAVFVEDGTEYPLDVNSIVSMNCWGFHPDIFEEVEIGFARFLSENTADPLKREYYLPYAVKELIDGGRCEVKVYSSADKWYGVTYKEDKENVKASIKKLIDSGVYPDKLS